MDFLPLLNEGVELGYPFQGQIIHQVDFVRIRDELVLESFHSNREGGRKETNLTIWRSLANKLL